MPTKYLAITIAGAVSLGSYEAGATYEILDAIRQHNENPETIATGDFIRIDVITGASAGGMTASILAQKLLFSKNAFVDSDGKSSPYDNPLYNTWVLGIDLKNLLDTVDKPYPAGDPAKLSLFSSNLIEQIAEKTLTEEGPDGKVLPDGGRHNAVDPGRGIQLGLALTNLNGVDYAHKLFGSGEFLYTQFSDQMLRYLSVEDRSLETWTEIREASVACGAFPIAFRTKDLLRKREDFLPCDNLDPWPDGETTHTFTYTDGGVLQNQPLGMAKNLVDVIDAGHLETESRFYLFVSPSPMSGKQNLVLHEVNADMMKVGKRLFDIYTGQSVFRDWVLADQVNKQIAILDERAQELAGKLIEGHLDVPSMTTASQQILDLLYQPPALGKPATSETQVQAKSRLTIQYSAEVRQLGGAETAEASAFVNALLALEKAAGLGDRDFMQIYGIVTDRTKLAGAGVSAFVGFFDQCYRDHDYDWGRTVAQQLLANPDFNDPAQNQLGPIRYTPTPIRPIDQDLSALLLKDIERSDVKAFKSGITKRLNEILNDSISNPLERYPIQMAADVVVCKLLDWEFGRDEQGA
jgi:predicted acylesterase/phospholipase RssA